MTNDAARSAHGASIDHAILGEPDQKTAEISTDHMRRILSDGSATVLDTRRRAEFDAGHIPRARHLDVAPDELVAAVSGLVNGNKDAALVLYCNGPYCQRSRQLADQLAAAGFRNVRRYQLGIPIWRALGGPTEIELDGIVRIFNEDRTAVFIDGRSPHEFARGSLAGACNAQVQTFLPGILNQNPMPKDDFNRRVILFGRDAAQARALADALRTRPWHNVAYFAGSYEALAAALPAK